MIRRVGIEQRVAGAVARIGAGVRVGAVIDEERLLRVLLRRAEVVHRDGAAARVQDRQSPTAPDVVPVAEGADHFAHLCDGRARSRPCRRSSRSPAPARSSTRLRFVLTRRPTSQAKFLPRDRPDVQRPSRSPRSVISPALRGHVEEPGARGDRQREDHVVDVRRYQVKLRSATSLKRPRSKPASNSLVRSGRRFARPVVSLYSPPNPFWVAVEIGAPTVEVGAPAQEREGREVRLRLGADLAVRRAQLAVAQHAAEVRRPW